jgi:hypothetical protein
MLSFAATQERTVFRRRITTRPKDPTPFRNPPGWRYNIAASGFSKEIDLSTTVIAVSGDGFGIAMNGLMTATKRTFPLSTLSSTTHWLVKHGQEMEHRL